MTARRLVAPRGFRTTLFWGAEVTAGLILERGLAIEGRVVSSGLMAWSFEIREPGDGPWREHQPKFERLVRVPPGGFGLVAKRPTGESMVVPLGRPPSVEDGWRGAPPKS